VSKAIKVIAILALIVTIAGALVVLYGVNTLVPQAVQVSVAATPAAQAQDTFDAVMDQVAQGTFHGRILSETGGVTADQAAFQYAFGRDMDVGVSWNKDDVMSAASTGFFAHRAGMRLCLSMETPYFGPADNIVTQEGLVEYGRCMARALKKARAEGVC